MIWCGCPAEAQSFHYGGLLGLNYSRFRWEPSPYIYPEHKLGLVAGGYVLLMLDPRACLRAELCWSQKGASATYSELVSDSATGLDLHKDYYTELNLDYWEAPLLFNLIIKRGDNELGILGLGPYLGWLGRGHLSTTMTATSGSLGYTQEYSLKEKDLRRTDFGIMAGLSAYFYNFEMNLRYSHGLRPVYTQRYEDINRFLDPVNRVWSFSLGYQIK